MRYDVLYTTMMSIVDQDVLEDRREYTAEDLMNMYVLMPEEAAQLHSWIDEQFRTPPKMATDLARAYIFMQMVDEAEHQNFDGWDDMAKGVIYLFLTDIRRAVRVSQEPTPTTASVRDIPEHTPTVDENDDDNDPTLVH